MRIIESNTEDGFINYLKPFVCTSNTNQHNPKANSEQTRGMYTQNKPCRTTSPLSGINEDDRERNHEQQLSNKDEERASQCSTVKTTDTSLFPFC